MRLLPFLLPATILAILHVVTGLITLDAIEKLTALTNELRGRIVGSDRFGDGGRHSLGQVWVDGSEDSKRDEVEDVSRLDSPFKGVGRKGGKRRD